MPLPDEVNAWRCVPAPDERQCLSTWQSCNECDGVEGPDDKCTTCTGSGGGYICRTHDTETALAQPQEATNG